MLLPVLITTFIALAFLEERFFLKKFAEEYEAYSKRIPVFFPLAKR